tara:strand:- start:20563 stop:21516 length:954 start_codon:yes stop_codon:yes gene_type:complete
MIKKSFLLILTIIFIIALFKYNNDINRENERKFSIEEIGRIDKIFLSDRKGNNIILSRNEQLWMVNEKFKVRADAIETLLSTIQQISIQRPVSEISYNNVIKQLATTGVKIEIYYGNNIKTYTVGGSTNDHLGTYMLMDNAENPYIVHIAGFNGFLSPRYGIQGYELDINTWRDNSIFKIKPEEIQEISLYDFKENNNSFIIKREPFLLMNNDSLSIKYDINKVIKYFNHFSKIGCEGFKGYNIDLSNERPLFKLKINYNNKVDILNTYTFSKTNNNSNNSKPNVERMYAILNNGEVMLIQNYVFNKVFISINELKE